MLGLRSEHLLDQYCRGQHRLLEQLQERLVAVHARQMQIEEKGAQLYDARGQMISSVAQVRLSDGVVALLQDGRLQLEVRFMSIQPSIQRTIYFVSDGTGITAETLGHAILAQFDITPRYVRLPFIDNREKAEHAVIKINQSVDTEGQRPIVFTTVIDKEVLAVLRQGCQALLLDLISTFASPMEQELGIKPLDRVGRFSDISHDSVYQNRIEAINFSLAHDDGQSHKDLEQSEVILIGVSRSGKTPTSLYLAMQHGIKVSNYPLIPEDFGRNELPPALLPYKDKLFGLTIDPERLAQIRHERRPDSHYASLN
ncbi:unnamed protein product, partial [Darwinula stevensoni]